MFWIRSFDTFRHFFKIENTPKRDFPYLTLLMSNNGSASTAADIGSGDGILDVFEFLLAGVGPHKCIIRAK